MTRYYPPPNDITQIALGDNKVGTVIEIVAHIDAGPAIHQINCVPVQLYYYVTAGNVCVDIEHVDAMYRTDE